VSVVPGAGFEGFDPALEGFLAELEANNDRTWFAANRARYEGDVLEPALAFVEAMAVRLPALSPHFLAIARRTGGSLMRVHRDTRFGHDKRPYKTNLGIQFRHELGRDVHAPGFYFHVDPDRVFLGAGMWRPDRVSLAAVRDRIAEQPGRWLGARDATLASGYRLGGERLKRAPRGYDPEHPMVEDLKRKDFIATRDLTHRDLRSATLADDVTAWFADGSPLVAFLCGAVGAAF
jgi:uncharacterized protein (TIGR02453 family)